MSCLEQSRRLFCLLLAILFVLVSSARGSERSRPNIVIILADDLGYGDVRCNNPERGRIPTPCIDRLASQGMRFTDAHSSSAVCSPTFSEHPFERRKRTDEGVPSKAARIGWRVAVSDHFGSV
jgi:Sulfatase